jgi:magnesium transporter
MCRLARKSPQEGFEKMQLTPTVISAQPLENAVREYFDRNDRVGLEHFVSKLRAPDIADVVDRLPESQRNELFALLPARLKSAVMAEAGQETKRSLLQDLSREQKRELIHHLSMDDVMRLLIAVPEQRDELLEETSPAVAESIKTVLEFPKESAGRLMTEKFVQARPIATAGEMLEHLRKVHGETETFTDVYITDEDGHLEGVISLRDLVLAQPKQQLREFMTKNVVTIAPTDDQEIAARLISHYNFLALPVVDQGRILGIITVDDIIDVLIAEGTEDQLRFGAVEPGVLNQPYFTTPIWRVVRSRVGWLVLLFVAETATGTVLRHFEDELARVVALSFFIPLLIGTGGNTGAQTVSTIIRGLALKEIRLRDTIRVVIREFWSGLLLGATLGLIAFGRAELWGSGFQLSLVVALSILAICAWANTIGSLIPLVAQRFKIDPALVSAPLITTLVDATGLAIYLLIAKALLSALR